MMEKYNFNSEITIKEYIQALSGLLDHDDYIAKMSRDYCKSLPDRLGKKQQEFIDNEARMHDKKKKD